MDNLGNLSKILEMFGGNNADMLKNISSNPLMGMLPALLNQTNSQPEKSDKPVSEVLYLITRD